MCLVKLAALLCVPLLFAVVARPGDARGGGPSVSPYGRVLVELSGVRNTGVPPLVTASVDLNRELHLLFGWHVGGGARLRWERVALRAGADLSVRGLGNSGSSSDNTGQVAPLFAVTPNLGFELRVGSTTGLFLEVGAPLQMWHIAASEARGIESIVLRGERIVYGVGFRALVGVTHTLSERAQLVWGVSHERHEGSVETVSGPHPSSYGTMFRAFGLFVGVSLGR